MPFDGPGVYRHYKGGQYRVMGLATHTETKEVMVVYAPDKGTGGLVRSGEVFVRPLDNFNQGVGGVAGTGIDAAPRFVRIG